MEEIEYCIWTETQGRMDSSMDWGYLQKLGSKHLKTFYIIPVESSGKGKYRTLSQIMKDHEKRLGEHEEFMRKHEKWKKIHNIN